MLIILLLPEKKRTVDTEKQGEKTLFDLRQRDWAGHDIVNQSVNHNNQQTDQVE